MAHVSQKFALGLGSGFRSLLCPAQVARVLMNQRKQPAFRDLQPLDAQSVEAHSCQYAPQSAEKDEPAGGVKVWYQGDRENRALGIPNAVIVGSNHTEEIFPRRQVRIVDVAVAGD